MRPNVVVISGPTASGKSNLALKIAAQNKGEIINADSLQVYRGFDIGSAKPLLEEMKLFPHHLFSILEPSAPFDAAEFTRLANEKIVQITSQGALPLVVGGTGLYISALLAGLVPTAALSRTVAAELDRYENELRFKGLSQGDIARNLHQALTQEDPHTAANLKSSDYQRTKRALLVYRSTGQSLSILQSQHAHQDRPYRALVIVVLPPRELLYDQIDQRVVKMIERGLLAETERLLADYGSECRGLKALGYRQVVEFLSGRINKEQMVEEIKRKTRHFAKRQYTWWRHQPERLGWQILDLSIDKHPENLTKISERVTALIENFLAEDSPLSGDGPFFVELLSSPLN